MCAKSQETKFSDADAIWQALLEYANNQETLQQRNKHCETVFAVNNQRISGIDDRLVPQSVDGSLDGYVSRVERLLGKNEWSVAFFGLHTASPTLWDSVQWFSRRLSQSVGNSLWGRLDIDCFIGRYSSTHTGVHVDNAHNFAFTLKPGKTMFTWPHTHEHLIGKKTPRYDAWKKEGLPLINKPGQVSYFPPDALHVAESKDSVSVVINVALWEHPAGRTDTNDPLSSGVSHHYVQKELQTTSGETVLHPDCALNWLPAQSGVDGVKAQRNALVHQLRSETSARMAVGRPPVEINYEDLLGGGFLSNQVTLQWAVTADMQEILVGVNGHVMALPYEPHTLAFLRSLLRAETISYALVKSHMKQEDPTDTIFALYSRLFQWGAIVER